MDYQPCLKVFNGEIRGLKRWVCFWAQVVLRQKTNRESRRMCVITTPVVI